MPKPDAEEILRELLTLEVEDGGIIYEVDFFEDLDISKVGPNINSIGAKIAFMEKTVARLKREVADLKSERDEWVAQEDKEVRGQRGYRRGEAKITQEIRRHPDWLQHCYAINEADERYEKAKGFLQSLYTTADLLRTKDSTYRKHEELAEPAKQYRSGKRFNIERRKKKAREKILETKKKRKKKKKKRTPVEEE